MKTVDPTTKNKNVEWGITKLSLTDNVKTENSILHHKQSLCVCVRGEGVGTGGQVESC